MISEMHINVIAQLGTGQVGGLGGFSLPNLLILGLCALASWLVSRKLRQRFDEYSQVPTRLTGAQVAEAMLRQNGIHDVQVLSVQGQLTDHYDPTKKTVNLSEGVFASNSVAAAAVAAHECGHAVQHQQAYVWLGLRSKLVPVVQLSSNLMNWVMMASLFVMAFMHNNTMLWVWVCLMGVTTLFSVITLPVEFDASRRALVWMQSSGVVANPDFPKAKNALHWAAMTYVVAAIGSLAQLLYYLMRALDRR